MIEKLDLRDKKILKELDQNARQPISKIAKKLRLNKDVVLYRIKRLEEKQIINGYYTLIDLQKLGFLHYRIYLNYQNVTLEKEKEIIDYLKKQNEVFMVAETEGVVDLAIGVLCQDIFEFEEIYNNFKLKYNKYIKNLDFSIFTKVYHFERDYLLDSKKEKKVVFLGRNQKLNHDELDIEILKLISKNARMSLVEMSIKLNVPAKTLAFRIKKLEEKDIIIGYKIMFDSSKLGFEYYKVDLFLNDLSKINSLIEFSKNNPYIIYIDQTVGGSDFEFDLEIDSKEKLYEIINEIRNIVEVKEWKYFTLRKYNKLKYF